MRKFFWKCGKFFDLVLIEEQMLQQKKNGALQFTFYNNIYELHITIILIYDSRTIK